MLFNPQKFLTHAPHRYYLPGDPYGAICSTRTAPRHSRSGDPSGATNGRSFKLVELYQLLDCQTVDVVRLTPELILVIDDEGKFRHPAYLNLLATYLWYQHQGTLRAETRGQDSIVGRAIICHGKQFK